MSVEIIVGRAGTGKTFACLREMKKILAAEPLKTEIIFLLPAYQTYRAELELAAITGGAVNTRMYSFQRFARQILSEVGGSIVPRISETGRRLLLRKILLARSKSDDLKYYRRAARQRGFAENLAQELKELRTYSIDAEKIRSVIELVEDEELSNKLHDLAIFEEDFRNAIADKQNDESDLLEKAAELINDSAAVRRAEIFIDGFIFFDPQQRKILREIFSHAKNVRITLPMNTELANEENTQQEVGLFYRSFETFKMIRDTAEEVDAEFKISRCENPVRFENDALKFLENNFFANAKNSMSIEPDGVKVVECVNKRVEVEAAAREIIKLCREKNFRFRDIGIISRDESYGNLVKSIFEIHNIPFFVDAKRAATHHPLAELIRSSVETLRGWRAEPIFRCLRTGFFEIQSEDIDLLENYVIEFNIHGETNWQPETVWTRHRHTFEKLEASDSEVKRLEKVNAIHRAAIEPLVNFANSIGKVKTAKNFVTALYNLMDGLKIYDKLVEWSELEESKGNLSLSKEHLKIWDDVINLLEQIFDSLGEDKMDLREFELIMNEGLDALEMSLIPPGLDEVTISQFDQNSLQNSKAIFLLGFSDESFPRKVEEKLLLSDADRLHLNDLHLEISKGGRESLLAEKFLVYRGLTEAKNFLYISYPLADSEGKAMRPSPLLDRLKEIFPAVKVETVGLDVLENLGSEADFAIGDKKIKSVSAKKLFAPAKRMSGSVTKFESYNQCPFQYFSKYGLGLEERREYKIFSYDVGNILHGIMRRFGETLKMENRRWAEVHEPELSERVEKILDELTPNVNNRILMTTGAYRHQRERIKKVAVNSLRRLTELDTHSKFHPELFETAFKALGKKSLHYEINGTDMELFGTIDRVDFSEDGNYFLIIDYKTGKAYLDLWEVFLGVNIQLLTYLMVANKIELIENRLPAAMLYYFLKNPVKTADTAAQALSKVNSELKMPGWLLNDVEIIRKIDGSEGQQFIKIRVNKDGKSINSGDRDKVKTAAEFGVLMRFVEEVIRRTGERILSGEVEAMPLKRGSKVACEFCDYKEICGFDLKKNKPREPARPDDEEIFDRMKNIVGS